MAKVRLKASAEDVKKALSSGDFEPAPVGLYVAELASCEPKYTKDESKPDGVDKDRPYLNCGWKIIGLLDNQDKTKQKPLPEGTNYGRVYDVVSFGESSKWKVAQFGITIGAKTKNGEIDDEVEIEADKPGTIIGTKAILRVKADKDQNSNYKPAVGFTGPLDGTKGDAASSAFADDPGDDDSGTDPFAEGSEDAEGFTEEQLEAEDLKSLGAILKENYDGSPQDHIVKTKAGKIDTAKTKAAVIQAILEAQSSGDEAGNEEDPF